MWKTLIYNNEKYDDFVINKNGEIKNLKTNHIYKKSLHKLSGYIIITLPMGERGKVKSIRLHKASAETFIPNPNRYTIYTYYQRNNLNYEELRKYLCNKLKEKIEDFNYNKDYKLSLLDKGV